MLNNDDCIVTVFELLPPKGFPGRFCFFTINKIKGVSNYV